MYFNSKKYSLVLTGTIELNSNWLQSMNVFMFSNKIMEYDVVVIILLMSFFIIVSEPFLSKYTYFKNCKEKLFILVRI